MARRGRLTEAFREFARRQISRLPPAAQDFLRRHLSRFRQGEILTRLIDRATRGVDSVSVVQIGSNDGVSDDPLHRLIIEHRDWSALFVEPLPDAFGRLTASYGFDPRFSFANVAVGRSAGRFSFTYIDQRIISDLPRVSRRVDQLSSLDRSHVEKFIPELARSIDAEVATIESYIRSIEVETITLTQLLDQFQIEKIDILHIDTEGHDWIVLSQLDISRWQPKVILFEHGHLSESDLGEAHDFLEGYDLRVFGRDTLCIRNETEAMKRTSRSAWRRWPLGGRTQ